MKSSTGVLIGLGLAGVGVYLFTRATPTNPEGNQVATTPAAQRAAIVAMVGQTQGMPPEVLQSFSNTVAQMTDEEVNAVYTYLFNYYAKGIDVPEGAFKDQLQAISDKYQIFT
jgi:hypothetical protein